MTKALPVSAPVTVNFPSPRVEEPSVDLPETVKLPVTSVSSLSESAELASESTPAVVIFNPLDVRWNVPVAFPITVLALPEALMEADPVA